MKQKEKRGELGKRLGIGELEQVSDGIKMRKV
jgi:hypothetical protein